MLDCCFIYCILRVRCPTESQSCLCVSVYLNPAVGVPCVWLLFACIFGCVWPRWVTVLSVCVCVFKSRSLSPMFLGVCRPIELRSCLCLSVCLSPAVWVPCVWSLFAYIFGCALPSWVAVLSVLVCIFRFRHCSSDILWILFWPISPSAVCSSSRKSTVGMVPTNLSCCHHDNNGGLRACRRETDIHALQICQQAK